MSWMTRIANGWDGAQPAMVRLTRAKQMCQKCKRAEGKGAQDTWAECDEEFNAALADERSADTFMRKYMGTGSVKMATPEGRMTRQANGWQGAQPAMAKLTRAKQMCQKCKRLEGKTPYEAWVECNDEFNQDLLETGFVEEYMTRYFGTGKSGEASAKGKAK